MNAMHIADTATQDAVAAAIGAISGQIGAAHEVVNGAAKAIGLPTNDTASLQAVAQQNLNTEQFGMMLRAGVAEMAKANAIMSTNNKVNIAADAAAAAAAAGIPS